MNESEILDNLEEINKNYDQKERFKKYYELIDKHELVFTTWLTYRNIDREFIYKWLERWDVIPEQIIDSIVKRYDYYIFYDTMIRKNCLIAFLKSILNTRDVFSDDINIIYNLISLKEHREDFTFFLKNLYDDYKHQKISNWFYSSHHPPIRQLKYIKNLLFLLVNIYKRGSNCGFLFQWIILFYDLCVFNITNYNKYQNCMGNMSFLFLVSGIHKYIFYNFLDEYCFRPGLLTIYTAYHSVDLVEELVTLYSKSYIQIGSESILEMFSNIFNSHYNRLNILQRIRILQCINYNICHNENENLFIGFNDLDLELLQRLYIDSSKLENHISCKVNILLFIVSILQKLDKQLSNKKFVYYFVQDLFKLLDDYSVYCDLYEEILQSDEPTEYTEQCRCYVEDTNSFIGSFSNMIRSEKENPNSIFYKSELQKKIIDGCILHINTLHQVKDKYNMIKSKHPLNIVYYINTLMDGILLYKGSERFSMYMNQCKTSLASIESELGKNNTEFKRYLNRASIQLEEIDETKLDAITSELLYDPVTLPTSKMVVNRDTIKLHLYENDYDPFTRIKFTESEINDFIKS
jgi:hypothetical protein